ncbi:MAG: HEAT repeat domain-containing protein [Planctomycetes bacterium]|nr:HEAT repeat domain-containing protein [Planctomycetota bacterium]
MPKSIVFFALGIVFCSATSIAFALDREIVEASETLERYRTDAMEQSRRETAIRALCRKDSPDAVMALLPVLGDEFEHVREIAVINLTGSESRATTLTNPDAIKTLISRGFAHPNPAVRVNVAEIILRLREDQTVKDELGNLLQIFKRERVGEVKSKLCEALGYLGAGNDDVAKEIAGAIGFDACHFEIPRALGRLGKLSELGDFDRALRRRSDWFRAGLADGCAIQNFRLTDVIKNIIESEDGFIPKIAAAEACAKLFESEPDAAFDFLGKAIADKDWRTRAAVIQTFVDIYDKRAVPYLIDALEKEQGRLALDAIQALKIITKRDIGSDPQLWRAWWNSNASTWQTSQPPEREDYGVDYAGIDVASGGGTVATFLNIPIYSKNVIFCFDPSGSMKTPISDDHPETSKIEFAAKQLERSLQAMPSDARFNLLLFRYWSEFPPRRTAQWALTQMMTVNPSSISQIGSFIASNEPRGWGDFFGAYMEVAKVEGVDTMFFFSDGGPSRGEHVRDNELLRAFQRESRFRRIKVNTLITGGSDADQRFMRNYAIATGGVSKVIDPSDFD